MNEEELQALLHRLAAETGGKPQDATVRFLAHQARVAGRCVVCGTGEPCSCMDCGTERNAVCDCEGNEHMKPMKCRVIAERVPMERVRDRKKERARAKVVRETIARMAARARGVTVEELQEELGRRSSTDKAALVRSLKAAARAGDVTKTARLRGESVIYVGAPVARSRSHHSARSRALPLIHEAIAATYRAEAGELGAVKNARDRLEQILGELS